MSGTPTFSVKRAPRKLWVLLIVITSGTTIVGLLTHRSRDGFLWGRSVIELACKANSTGTVSLPWKSRVDLVVRSGPPGCITPLVIRPRNRQGEWTDHFWADPQSDVLVIAYFRKGGHSGWITDGPAQWHALSTPDKDVVSGFRWSNSTEDDIRISIYMLNERR